MVTVFERHINPVTTTRNQSADENRGQVTGWRRDRRGVRRGNCNLTYFHFSPVAWKAGKERNMKAYSPPESFKRGRVVITVLGCEIILDLRLVISIGIYKTEETDNPRNHFLLATRYFALPQLSFSLSRSLSPFEHANFFSYPSVVSGTFVSDKGEVPRNLSNEKYTQLVETK